MINNYLILGLSVFVISIIGILLNRKNLIIMLMSLELMLLAINCNFLSFSVIIEDILGQVFSVFILTVAAAESAIGLSLMIVYFRITGNISILFIDLLKG
uniref:NADH dehydrogenase subunit 4L n=1 Tax=Sphaerothecum destruens TaxID=42893 RepID=A0A6H2U2C7_9EUKA|nr:NADH dehydrogenase subunit 4L [Sphaerothecum destruens]QID02700.1 NADH dehydrogenase subunit 4L [Sphaerothecum destruens]